MKIRERAITGVAAAISIGGALLLWQFFTQRSESYFFPTPSTVFPHLWADTGGFGEPAYLSSTASDHFLGDGLFEGVVMYGVAGATMFYLAKKPFKPNADSEEESGD